MFWTILVFPILSYHPKEDVPDFSHFHCPLKFFQGLWPYNIDLKVWTTNANGVKPSFVPTCHVPCVSLILIGGSVAWFWS